MWRPNSSFSQATQGLFYWVSWRHCWVRTNKNFRFHVRLQTCDSNTNTQMVDGCTSDCHCLYLLKIDFVCTFHKKLNGAPDGRYNTVLATKKKKLRCCACIQKMCCKYAVVLRFLYDKDTSSSEVERHVHKKSSSKRRQQKLIPASVLLTSLSVLGTMYFFLIVLLDIST